AVIFDMDGVITDTASEHAEAWRRLFDEYLRERAVRTGEPFVPFDADDDYRRYIDGKGRFDGVRSFLASRGIELPEGYPNDPPDRETICGLGNRKNEMFLENPRPPPRAPSPLAVAPCPRGADTRDRDGRDLREPEHDRGPGRGRTRGPLHGHGRRNRPRCARSPRQAGSGDVRRGRSASRGGPPAGGGGRGRARRRGGRRAGWVRIRGRCRSHWPRGRPAGRWRRRG